MMTEEYKTFYVDQSRMYFQFLQECHQWSGFDSLKVKAWLNNFNNTTDEQYVACRLLSHLLSYSEQDVFLLLKDTIFGIFEKETVLQLQLATSFGSISSALEFSTKKALGETIFVPLFTSKKPGDSGIGILRILTQKFQPTMKQSFCETLEQGNSYKRIVLLDDCIGSGEQFDDYWSEATVKDGTLLRDWCKKNNITPYYVVLVGYDKSISLLQDKHKDISIFCAEIIDDHHKIFGKESYCWENTEDLDAAKMIVSDTLQPYGIPLYGYRDLDFAVVLHNTIPDWSLPLFYKEKNGWKLLIERKDSYE